MGAGRGRPFVGFLYLILLGLKFAELKENKTCRGYAARWLRCTQGVGDERRLPLYRRTLATTARLFARECVYARAIGMSIYLMYTNCLPLSHSQKLYKRFMVCDPVKSVNV